MLRDIIIGSLSLSAQTLSHGRHEVHANERRQPLSLSTPFHHYGRHYDHDDYNQRHYRTANLPECPLALPSTKLIHATEEELMRQWRCGPLIGNHLLQHALFT